MNFYVWELTETFQIKFKQKI